MDDTHLVRGMQGLALRLNAALQASGPLGDSLTKGELREEEVIDAFRPHLPRRYELIKGIIVDSKGRESDPQDIILVDSFAMPPIFGRGQTKAVPVESVVGVIQVKSAADSMTAKDAVKNVASAKRLLPEEERFGYTPAGSGQSYMQKTSASFFGGALFLSKKAKKNETIGNAYSRAVLDLPRRERCDAFCVLNEFTVIWGNPSESSPGDPRIAFRGEQAETLLNMMSDFYSSIFFYLCLAEHLANWVSPPVSWLKYFRVGTEFEYAWWEPE